jgi:hypothetical protein
MAKLWPSLQKMGIPWGFHGFNITRLGIASSMGVFPWGCMPGVSNLHMLGYNPYNYGYVSHLFVELHPKYGLGAREWIWEPPAGILDTQWHQAYADTCGYHYTHLHNMRMFFWGLMIQTLAPCTKSPSSGKSSWCRDSLVIPIKQRWNHVNLRTWSGCT